MQFRSLERAVFHLKETTIIGLDVLRLSIASVCVVVLSDASFASAGRMKNQLYSVILLAKGHKGAYIVHYGSTRCHTVSPRVIAVEFHVLPHAFRISLVVRKALGKLLDRRIELEAFEDSRTLINVIANNSITAERGLQIDVCALAESYRKGELRNFGWVPSRENAAHVLKEDILSTRVPCDNR